jgi:Tol biopolymer transport system component
MKILRYSAIAIAILAFVLPRPGADAQETNFGKNKVQYRAFNWYYIQSAHFDIYFTGDADYLADFTADIAESMLTSLNSAFRYQITARIPIVVYNSHNDFQQTNVVSEYMDEGIGGVTELFKNRIVLPFEGDYAKFRHVIRHELVHAVINEMFYGGSIQSIISNNLTLQLPLWFNEGIAEYEALKWDTNSDMYIADATLHESLPAIDRLNGYFAYRGGQSVWNYIANKYGDQKIAEILSRIRGTRSVDQGFRAAIGLSVEELSERWQKEQKVLYWPDIAKRQEPADYARRLTDHTKDGSFYNTSPSISPQGDRIAFISNRDDYFDVYIMNAIDGTIQDKLINGQRTADFEELHLLTPGMGWSPDGNRIALAAKSGEQDAVIIINVENGHKEKYEYDLDGIFSISWSAGDSTKPNGMIAFEGLKDGRSDIYTFDPDTHTIANLTGDIFSDGDPEWSPDGKSLYFTSDRANYLDPAAIPANFRMQNYEGGNTDIYRMDLPSRKITRITEFPLSEQTSPTPAPDGKHLLFISDMNGINNIYMKDLVTDSVAAKTNSIAGVYQLSLSRNGSKLVFASLTNSGFDLFLMRSPLDNEMIPGRLEPTEFIRRITGKPAAADSLTARRDSISLGGAVVKMEKHDSTNVYGNDVHIDLRNYVFNQNFSDHGSQRLDTAKIVPVVNNVDTNGNYRVNHYKLNFSPDIVYGNAGYNTFYGVEGSTIMAFSDMLGDHQIYLLTNLLFDLKNSDYAAAYFYLPKRIDYGIQAFHSARFVYLNRTDQYGESVDYLYRFRNYGLTGMAQYPVSRFDRWEFSASWFNISRDNLDISTEPTATRTLVVPSLGYVHDNSLWGIIAPDNGERYNVTVMASPKFGDQMLGFTSVTFDYRNYFKFWRRYTFALRLAGGGSFGADPQRFIIGGVDNWINRQFANDHVPIDSVSDFVFLTSGIPLRGYDYAARTGTKYGLVNMELRFPLFGYLSAGPIPIFFQTFSGALFMDVGGTWNNRNDFKGIDRDANNQVYMRDLLGGMGYGVRMVFLGFLLKLDVAWAYDLRNFSLPKYYFSVGPDL